MTLKYPFAEAVVDDPLYRLTFVDIDEFLTGETYPHLVEGVDERVNDFMSLVVQCFKEDPEQRPKIIELANHPFIAS